MSAQHVEEPSAALSVRRGDDIVVRVTQVEQAADRVKWFRLEPIAGRLPAFSGGAHVVVTLEVGDRLLRNPYSLVGDPGQSGADAGAYEIAVLRVDGSRGGSEHLHTAVGPGDELVISPPGNLFQIHQPARRHLLVAGGIGITPFVPMAAQLARGGRDVELHHGVRTRTSSPFGKMLADRLGDRFHLHCDAAGEQLDVETLLADQPIGTHLYVCGPEAMIQHVLGCARAAGWPEDSLHCERFVSPPAGAPFTARLERAGLEVHVGERESLLEAIEAVGVEPPFLCRGGACGQCETRVLRADGELEHLDHYLDDDERRAGEKMMICMSRFQGRELVLDL